MTKTDDVIEMYNNRMDEILEKLLALEDKVCKEMPFTFFKDKSSLTVHIHKVRIFVDDNRSKWEEEAQKIADHEPDGTDLAEQTMSDAEKSLGFEDEDRYKKR